MTPYPHPHTIADGVGSTLTFLGVEDDRLLVENALAPGAGPPMHIHLLQDESITVQSGTLSYEIPGQPVDTLGPGETASFAAGVAHRFWNSGEDELRCSGVIHPPHNVEYFLTQLYESTRRNGGGRPDAFDGAWLTHHYRSEFAMLTIPRPVQQFIFPLVRTLGRLRGHHRRFDGAPEPVRAR